MVIGDDYDSEFRFEGRPSIRSSVSTAVGGSSMWSPSRR
jgi:hypothetical protein